MIFPYDNRGRINGLTTLKRGDEKTLAVGDPELMEWMSDHGIDPSDVYQIDLISWSEHSRVLGAVFYMFASPRRALFRRWMVRKLPKLRSL